MSTQVVSASLFAQEKALRQRVLLFAITIAVFYGIWFSILSFRLGNYVLATVDLGMALLFIFAGTVAIKRPDSPLPANIVAFSTAAFFLYLFVSGGIAGIGPLWSFILPLIIFFLTGFKGGVIISLAYLLACVGVFIYNRFFPGLFYDHSLIFIERFIGIYLLSAVVSGAYEFQKQKNETTLHELLEEIKEARDRAETANEAKSSFLAIVSHEIRTPINGINGMAELLSGTATTQQQKRYISLMRSSCDTLLLLIKDILDLSKIESGKMFLEETEFDLKSLIEETVDPFVVKASSKGLKISLSLSKEIPEILFGDPTRLKQILANLFDNALKFTEEGEIFLKVTPTASSSELVEILFEVIDTGIGIQPGSLERIFEDFHQADTSTSRKYGGAGLGLAISRKLAGLMGGKIAGESQPGQGSRFYFNIPFKTKFG